LTISQFCGSLSPFNNRDVVTSPAIAGSDVEARIVDARNPTRKLERSFMVSSSLPLQGVWLYLIGSDLAIERLV
jgi:hypothetical protein